MASFTPSQLSAALERFIAWLNQFGETSQDHQDFYASAAGRAAKNLYYRNPLLGKAAVLPMVACEAFAPWTRKYFYPRMRLPIADAHFAMGYAALHRATGKQHHLDRAIHFLEVLGATRCPGFERHGWGYPFDWQTRNGIIAKGTPLITTTPYCYEAYADVFRIDGNERWRASMRSTAEHVLLDYQDVPAGANAATCTYTPTYGEKVVNASAYRAGNLFLAWRDFRDDRYRTPAELNLNFVLQSQQADGSWPYAMDGVRPFVDHFHTCFVLKGLAKSEPYTANRPAVTAAIQRGIKYYVENLFADDGLPRPFARAPRLTLYRRELYDCAECINLGYLLRGRFPALDQAVDRTITTMINEWQLPDGHFRSRKLLAGWDNVPMHRWGQSEMFRALALTLADATSERKTPDNAPSST